MSDTIAVGTSAVGTSAVDTEGAGTATADSGERRGRGTGGLTTAPAVWEGWERLYAGLERSAEDA